MISYHLRCHIDIWFNYKAFMVLGSLDVFIVIYFTVSPNIWGNRLVYCLTNEKINIKHKLWIIICIFV